MADDTDELQKKVLQGGMEKDAASQQLPTNTSGNRLIGRYVSKPTPTSNSNSVPTNSNSAPKK